MLQSTRRKYMALTAGLMCLVFAVPSHAHHGFTGEYDATRPIYIEGTVQQVTVAYPHVEMTIEVADAASVPGELPDISALGIEGVMDLISPAEPGTYDLQIAGLQEELEGNIASGDKIALVALRNCLPPNQYRSRWIRIASGEVVSLAGRTQTEVNGCDA
jgi:Family of unknown function (DUF6152)